jgi:hypothetical protein
VVHFDEVLVPQCEYPVQDPVLCSTEVCDDLDDDETPGFIAVFKGSSRVKVDMFARF